MVKNMKFNKKSLLLYAVTDRAWLKNGDTLYTQVERALKGGVTCVQLREKDLPENEFLKEAIEIRELCRKYSVPFIINDNIDIAVKCNADGVHVGQSDMSARRVREIIGNKMILGVSAQTIEQAISAEKDGADYLGTGAVFSTSTKLNANRVSFDTLKQITKSVNIPVIAIGGINEDNILSLKGSGICGVAVVSAIFASEDIEEASKRLYNLSKGCDYID